ncbi:MAG: hypothetical protein WCY01_08715 [Alkalispirochaeta sp.]
MSDRFRKKKQRKRRVRAVLFFVTTALIWYFAGPGNAIIRTSALSPLLEPGDVALMIPVYGRPRKNTVLLVRTPLRYQTIAGRIGNLVAQVSGEELPEARQPRRVPRIVLAGEGDQVTWNDRLVVVRRAESVATYRLAPLDRDLSLPLRQTRIQAGEFFLVSLQPGIIDSRYTGPVNPGRRVYRLGRVVWPYDRRNQLTADEIRLHL